MTTDFWNADSFKEFEHKGWELSVEHYHDGFGPLTAQAIPFILRGVELQKNDMFLDIASGPGYLAAAASDSGAKVTAVDFSANMVRKASTVFPAVKFTVGDAESLDFPDDTFDAVGMNFGMLHLENPVAAIKEAYRVLKSGARFAFSVWAPPEEALGFGLILKTIQEHGDPSIVLPPGPPFFQYSSREASEAALHEAGFTEFRWDKAPLVWKTPSSAYVVDSFLHGAVRTGALLRAQPPAALEKIKGVLIEGLKPFQINGGLEIPMPAVIASGRKPLEG